MTDTAAVAAMYDFKPQQEHQRLTIFALEYAISMHAILNCIEKIKSAKGITQLSVLDLGGGTGRYCNAPDRQHPTGVSSLTVPTTAIELAKRGHTVTLTDISAAEMSHAREYAAQEDVQLEKIAVIDASRVTEHEVFGTNRYDLILCQGPFYHLLHLHEREKLLRDCDTMCKPGGFVMAAFLTKWGHLRDIARKDPERLLREANFYGRYVQDGLYNREENRTSYHTSTKDIQMLFKGAFRDTESGQRLQIQRTWACESFIGGGLSQNLSTLPSKAFQEWVKLCIAHAGEPDMLGAADMLLVAAQKCES